GAERMSQLIDALLEQSRLGTAELKLVPVSLARCLEQVCETLGLGRGSDAGEVSWGELPTVLADPVHLVQVLQNLVGNGLKFRSEAPPRVRVEARVGEDEVVVCVQDNGIGIDPEHVERAFEMFQRLHPRGT